MAEITDERAPLVFKVKRQAPEVIQPAKATPYEVKEVSTLEDQLWVRRLTPTIHFYASKFHSSACVRDPAKVIKEAVAKALVWYYPLAGRLRESQGRKLVVECNGEGIVFVEADADVSLEDFGEPLLPPFPYADQLFYDVPGSYAALGSPLVVIQVTRLRCGGFIMGHRLSHVMMDAVGMVQFLDAVAKLAQGAETPSIVPVWERNFLRAGDPPRVTCVHPEYHVMKKSSRIVFPFDDIVRKYFFFGQKEINALQQLVPHNLKFTPFEIITASVWRCRTIALGLDPVDEVRVTFIVNTRSVANLNLPTGYYGNAIIDATAASTVGKLSTNPYEYALQLVRKAKVDVTAEYIRSFLDIIVTKGEAPEQPLGQEFWVSDVTRSGFAGIDFGWGLPAYSGPAAEMGEVPGIGCFYLAYKSSKGEIGTVVPLCLPPMAMRIFVKELSGLLTTHPKYAPSNPTSSL